MGAPERIFQIRRIEAGERDGVHRVSADVDGAALWFESADVPLAARAEAFGTACLVPALARGARLLLDEPVSSRWLAGARELLTIFRDWWGYSTVLPQAAVEERVEPALPRGTALCFTAGVDSFYSLLCCPLPLEVLVFVHGFDIPLTDQARMTGFEPRFRQIARAHGARAVLLRTNLRTHHAFLEPAWERTHGGALAAIGHLLSSTISRLLISSSVDYRWAQPWGSHWRTDPLWSSEQLAVVNWGTAASRSQKIRAIAGNALVREHLRVCWENRAPTGNCSHCDKCVATMVELERLGQLQAFAVFDRSASLVERLDALPRTTYPIAYRSLLAKGPGDELDRAIGRLLARSRSLARRVRGLSRLAGRRTGRP